MRLSFVSLGLSQPLYLDLFQEGGGDVCVPVYVKKQLVLTFFSASSLCYLFNSEFIYYFWVSHNFTITANTMAHSAPNDASLQTAGNTE
jgi:hypothetical protein